MTYPMGCLCGNPDTIYIAPEPHASARAGADVTHPMGFSETEPSIVAVVGSLDRFCLRYAAEVLLQGHRVEIIQARPHPLGLGWAAIVLCATILHRAQLVMWIRPPFP